MKNMSVTKKIFSILVISTMLCGCIQPPQQKAFSSMKLSLAFMSASTVKNSAERAITSGVSSDTLDGISAGGFERDNLCDFDVHVDHTTGYAEVVCFLKTPSFQDGDHISFERSETDGKWRCDYYVSGVPHKNLSSCKLMEDE